MYDYIKWILFFGILSILLQTGNYIRKIPEIGWEGVLLEFQHGTNISTLKTSSLKEDTQTILDKKSIEINFKEKKKINDLTFSSYNDDFNNTF